MSNWIDAEVIPWFLPADVVDVCGADTIGGVDLTALASSPIASAVAMAGHQDTLKDLSPMAGALASSLDKGLGAAVGVDSLSSMAGSVAKDVASSISEDLGETIGDIAGDLAEAVPVIGALIKAVIAVVDFAVQAEASPPGETPSQKCQQLFQNLVPQKSGSMLGGTTVPADMFANVTPLGVYWRGQAARPGDIKAIQDLITQHGMFWSVWSKPSDLEAMTMTCPFYLAGPLYCRSAIGMSLMQITEGCLYDLSDFNWNTVLTVAQSINDSIRPGAGKEQFKSAKGVRAMWEKSIERDARVMVETWKGNHPKDKSIGLPKAWRDRFRVLRRGIEASYGPKSKKTTDGGVGLWTTYIDLFVKAYESGYLTDDFVEWIFARQSGSFSGWNIGPMYQLQTDPGNPLPGSNSFAAVNYFLGRHADELHQQQWQALNERLLGSVPDKDYVAAGTSAAPFTWIWGYDPCPRNIAYQVRQIINSWKNTVHPHYAVGKEKVADITKKAHAVAVARGKKIRSGGRHVPASTKRRPGTSAPKR